MTPNEVARICVTLVLLLGLTAPAQTQTPMSALTGMVLLDDDGGFAGGGIVIRAESEGGGPGHWETRTTDYGFYRLVVPAGRYRVSVPVDPPLQSFVASVEVPPWQEVVLHIPLRLRTDESVHVVLRNAPDLDVSLASRTISTGIDFLRTDIDQMPLSHGRTLQTLLSLVPGVVFTDSVGNLAQFTSLGQRRFSNRLTVDGIAADLAVDARGQLAGEAASGALPASSTSGGTQTIIPLDAIGEIHVRTTNVSSQYARTPGAQTSVITRSGGDRFAGTGFLSARPNSLAAAEWFTNASQAPPRRRQLWETGASLGGPMVAGRVFAYTSWERQRLDRAITTTIRVPSRSVRQAAPVTLQPILSAFPMPNGPEIGGDLAEYSGRVPAGSDLWTLSLRSDVNLSDRHHLFVRAGAGDSSGDALLGAPQKQQPSLAFTNRESTTVRTVTTALTSAWAGFANDLRFSRTRHRGDLVASQASFGSSSPLPVSLLAAPGLSSGEVWAAVGLFPGEEFVASGRTGGQNQEQLQLIDTSTVVRGRHQLTFGVDYRRIEARLNGAADQYGYRFNSVADFLAGRARSVTVQHVAPARVGIVHWSAFAQDAFHLSGRMSIEYGVRYSVNPAPVSLTGMHPKLFEFPTTTERPEGGPLWNTQHGNLAPRLAAAYRIRETDGQETTVRAGWSLAVDELTSPGVRAFTRGYPYVSTRNLGRMPFPVPVESLPIATGAPLATVDRAEYYAFPRDLRSPRTYQWHAGIEHELGPTQRLSVSYVGSTARDLIFWQAYQAGDAAHIVHAFSNDATSNYHALLAEYVRRMRRGLSGRIAYSWSHAIDDDSGEALAPNPPSSVLSPSGNRGDADFDRRHTLRGLLSYQLPTSRLPMPLRRICGEWSLDVVGMYISGTPVSVTGTWPLDDGTLYDLRADAVPGTPQWIRDPAVATGWRLNPAAFAAPTERRQGTLGRNSLRTSPLRQLDLGISRTFRVSSGVAQVRFEAFNVLNIPNFGPPDGSLLALQFGRPMQTYADSLGAGSLFAGGLTPILQVGGPRMLQLSLRLAF
jgi:hypothetical protein